VHSTAVTVQRKISVRKTKKKITSSDWIKMLAVFSTTWLPAEESCMTVMQHDHQQFRIKSKEMKRPMVRVLCYTQRQSIRTCNMSLNSMASALTHARHVLPKRKGVIQPLCHTILAIFNPSSPLSQTVTSCWPPNNYVTFDQPPPPRAPSTPVETTYRNVLLLSLYVNSVIFSFFLGFLSKFCKKLHKFSEFIFLYPTSYCCSQTKQNKGSA